MPNETAISNSTSCSAWQQSSSINKTSTDITPPDTALLPVQKNKIHLICQTKKRQRFFFLLFVAKGLAESS